MPIRSWAFGLAAILSSAACSNHAEDEELEYGRDEVKNAIEGTWEGTSTPANGESAPVALTLLYSNGTTHALCSSRTLAYGGTLDANVGPSCMTISSMNVTGTFTARSTASAPPQDVPVRGTFDVWGLRFTGDGYLEADLDDGRHLTASLANDVLEASIGSSDGTTHFTLRRR